MKWYDLLITDEFVDYFSDDSNIFYTKKDNAEHGYTPQSIFAKFVDTVNAITYAFQRLSLSNDFFLSSFKNKPVICDAYIRCQNSMPETITLADIWKSIKCDEGDTPYQVDVKTLNAEQIAVVILYPFWSRMGGSWEIEFLDSGRLKQYLLELKRKAQQEV